MTTQTYSLKISSQGQLTLPRKLRDRLHLKPGSRIAVTVTEEGDLKLSDKPPVAAYFGTMPGLWTAPGQDAADYTRSLRDSMQPKIGD